MEAERIARAEQSHKNADEMIASIKKAFGEHKESCSMDFLRTQLVYAYQFGWADGITFQLNEEIKRLEKK